MAGVGRGWPHPSGQLFGPWPDGGRPQALAAWQLALDAGPFRQIATIIGRMVAARSAFRAQPGAARLARPPLVPRPIARVMGCLALARFTYAPALEHFATGWAWWPGLSGVGRTFVPRFRALAKGSAP